MPGGGVGSPLTSLTVPEPDRSIIVLVTMKVKVALNVGRSYGAENKQLRFHAV